VLDADGLEQPLDREPDSSWWRCMRLCLIALPVPEREL